jgi:hypothetical protein
MASLKSFLPQMSEVLGTTVDLLYGRQRALVDLGLLVSTEGRGPGSGVVLSSGTVATMLITFLATESLSEIDGHLAALCKAKPKGKRRTGYYQRSFQADVGKALVFHPLPDIGQQTYSSICVTRGAGGQIYFDGGKRSLDYLLEEKHQKIRPVFVTASLESDALQQLQFRLTSALSDEYGDEE